MARSAAKAPRSASPSASDATATPSASAAPEGSGSADQGGRRYVRLTGSGTYEGGRYLAAGQALEVGVEISERLAEVRLAAGDAETVLGSSAAAEAVRVALGDVLARIRTNVSAVEAAAAAAGGGDLAEIVRQGLSGNLEDQAAALALDEAMDALGIALDAEAEPTAPAVENPPPESGAA